MPIFAVCSLDTREGEITSSEVATGTKERLAGSRRHNDDASRVWPADCRRNQRVGEGRLGVTNGTILDLRM
jgi:hypothetical protein